MADYNEMAIQIGFMTMFAVALPIGPLLALLNNLLELRIDAGKLTPGGAHGSAPLLALLRPEMRRPRRAAAAAPTAQTISGSIIPQPARALFLYQGGYPKLDKDCAGYPPTPP
eukprot:COSAG01_NODE_44619_length_417_cov_0.877358_1_plen_112_part_01